MVEQTSTKGVADRAEVKARKGRRRRALQCFTAEGQPGEEVAQHHRRLAEALRLPGDAVARAGPEELRRLGLGSQRCGLLPSFLQLMRELKRAGRSFSGPHLATQSAPVRLGFYYYSG